MKEIWKPITDFENYYEVSNIGNIRRIEGSSHLKSKNLKMIPDKDGYHRVNLKVNQKTHSRIVHRIIAIEFIPNPDKKPQVNHLNGIKNDNRLENLEWVTLTENRVHAYSTGLQNGLSRRGQKNNFVKLTEKQVKWVRDNYAGDVRLIPRRDRYKYWTAKKMAHELNVTEGCVLSIINNKSWKYLQ